MCKIIFSDEKEILIERISFLENRLLELRTSRKALLFLLEELVEERKILETENRKLKFKNTHLINLLSQDRIWLDDIKKHFG